MQQLPLGHPMKQPSPESIQRAYKNWGGGGVGVAGGRINGRNHWEQPTRVKESLDMSLSSAKQNGIKNHLYRELPPKETTAIALAEVDMI